MPNPLKSWIAGIPGLTAVTLAAAGGISALVLWGGFSAYVEYSNTMEFCVSCHEMRTNILPEYKLSSHYANRSGVRAICSDCHVPRGFLAKMTRKVQATNELFHKIMGSVDTPEKFEAKRLTLANRVWTSMKESDSRECRNCHAFEAMDPERQQELSAALHGQAPAMGTTCIDCHKGIAHRLPRMEDQTAP